VLERHEVLAAIGLVEGDIVLLLKQQLAIFRQLQYLPEREPGLVNIA